MPCPYVDECGYKPKSLTMKEINPEHHRDYCSDDAAYAGCCWFVNRLSVGEMDKYSVEIKGTFDYDMMPRVRSAKLLCIGFVENYEIEIDPDEINIRKVQSSQ